MLVKDTLQIVILQRGWVAIGYLAQSGSYCTLSHPKIIRRWGTSAGLGQLAIDGPQPNTVCDDAMTMRFHELTVVAIMDVDAAKWRVVYER